MFLILSSGSLLKNYSIRVVD